jgi:ElaB/YqjD/DUF883 family membrane-anchored ribosome-binding protein
MATPTPRDATDVGRIEHDIERVRDDLGRTVQEIGSRLTPAHLMEQARRSLRDTTVETTRAVAQSATEVAGEVATRTRNAALDTRDRMQAHPYTAGALGAGVGLGYWLVARSRRNPRRLVPREWDEPFDRSSRRAAAATRGASPAMPISQLIPVAAAATAMWLLWRNRA